LKDELANTMKSATYATTIAVQSALEARDTDFRAKSAREAEYKATVNDLYSVMPRPTADKLLKDNLPIGALKSMIEVLKGSGAARVGVSAGIEMRSTVNTRSRMEALGIPEIQFNTGSE
jgi:hypothetical protein